MKAICGVCPHACELGENQRGLCRARANTGGSVGPVSYGLITSLALDPIEKKPLYRFYPGSYILSCGSFGCNLRCGFCQNHQISMAAEGVSAEYIPPEELVSLAKRAAAQKNIGVAFTYNEPLICPEYVLDCSKLLREAGLKSVLVTNGYTSGETLSELLPYIDAMNIDLKCYNEAFYRELGGGLEAVRHTIVEAAKTCHVEVTTLIIPGKNDSVGEMLDISAFIAGVSEEIPLHITRFFPRYKYLSLEPTPIDGLDALVSAARRNLRHVYRGTI